MNHPALDLIRKRTSTNLFDASHELDEATISELVDYAVEAPSSMNFQNWRFIAVRSAERKQALLAQAYGPQKVADAAVTFIICGKLQPHLGLRAAWQPMLDSGRIAADAVDKMVADASASYADDAQHQRDEAVRSGALAAMTLMLAAEAMGLASGPMGGFDADGVSAEFGLSGGEVPVMLVTVGRPAAGNRPRKPRLGSDHVLMLV